MSSRAEGEGSRRHLRNEIPRFARDDMYAERPSRDYAVARMTVTQNDQVITAQWLGMTCAQNDQVVTTQWLGMTCAQNDQVVTTQRLFSGQTRGGLGDRP